MICRNCYNEINDNAKFCPHCGNVIEQTEEMQVPFITTTVEQTEASDKQDIKKKDKKKKGRSNKLIGILSFVLAVISALVFVWSSCDIVMSFIKSSDCKDNIQKFYGKVPYKEELEYARVELLFAIKDVEDAINSGDYDTIYNSTEQMQIAENKSQEYEEVFNKVKTEIKVNANAVQAIVPASLDEPYNYPLSFSTKYYNEYREYALECLDDDLFGPERLEYFRKEHSTVGTDGVLRYDFDIQKAINDDYDEFLYDIDEIENYLNNEYLRAEKYIRSSFIVLFTSGILAVVFFIAGRKCTRKKKADDYQKTA